MENDRQEWASFRVLPWKKKLEHIWYYYKWYFLVAAALIYVAVSIAGTVAENRKQTLISGMFINNSTSPEGYAHLMEGYWEHCGGNENQKVELVTGRTIRFDEETLSPEDAASSLIVTSMISAGTLDYIITDEASLDDFEAQGVVLDLKELLPAQTLAQWDAIGHDGMVTALGLENTAFGRAYPLSAEHSCILVVANTQNRENMVHFLKYVMAG